MGLIKAAISAAGGVMADQLKAEFVSALQPVDPANAPRFCPECGDPFDSADII